MRKGRRTFCLLVGAVAVLASATGLAAPLGTSARSLASQDATLARMTVEVRWSAPELPALPDGSRESLEQPIEVELSEGRIVDAVAVPARGWTWPARPAPGVAPRKKPEPSQGWTLGSRSGGSARLRLEAPIGASLVVSSGGQPTRFPLAGLLDAGEQSPPTSNVRVTIRRLAWDAVEVDLGEGDGQFAPGAKAPISVGFNFLLAEPEDVVASYSAELRPARGSAIVWRFDAPPEVMAANATSVPRRKLDVALPTEEGTYLLEVRTTWEVASAAEGSRLTRLFRRKKSSGPVTVRRRMSLVVVDPAAGASQSKQVEASAPGIVDAVDFVKGRPSRPMISGKTGLAETSGELWSVPATALVEPGLRDRVRGWIARGSDAVLSPADQAGLSWAAMGLRVRNPGRPHQLRISFADPLPSEGVGVALVDPGRGSQGHEPRILLDSRANPGEVEAVPAPGPNGATWRSWLVWPDVEQPLLTLVNRSNRSSARVLAVELSELGETLAAAPLVAPPGSEPGRELAIDVARPDELDRFGGAVDGLSGRDVIQVGRNLADYAVHCGASSVVLPSALCDRAARRRLDGQASEDAIGPDGLELCLAMLRRREIGAVLDVACDEALEGLPAPDSQEARARGLAWIDARGQGQPAAYHLLHPDVRSALEARLAEAIQPRLTHPNLHGLVVRLGSGPMVLGPPDTGLEDATYLTFIRDTFSNAESSSVPGLDARKADWRAARARFVTGPGRSAWLEWRARQVALVYERFSERVGAAAPGATLAIVTPGLDDGAAGAALRSADDEGQPPDQAWQSVGLDFARWTTSENSPLVYRGIEAAADGLESDLAVSPELDRAVGTRPRRGYWVGVEDTRESGDGSTLLLASRRPVTDQALGHALAVLDPKAVVLSAASIAGREVAVSGFARIFRALPTPRDDGSPSPRLPSGVAVRAMAADGHTYVAVANDTPYEVLQAMTLKGAAKSSIDDLGRGLRLEPAAAKGGGEELVLRLPPFGVAAIRIAAPKVEVVPAASYLPALPDLEARAQTISQRLEHGASLSGPPLPGFEPASGGTAPVGSGGRGAPIAEIPPLPGQASAVRDGDATQTLPPLLGWTLTSGGPNQMLLDEAGPHSGRAALRIDAKVAPVSAASDAFLPPGGTTLLLRTWLRCDREGGRVRVWIEGGSKGERVVRHADVEVGRAWVERTVRVPELPEGGLDSLRVRYEWLGPVPAVVWIDDLDVTGGGPSATGKRAQRALLEALQAYRAKRYADFARLLGSHRVRKATPELDGGAGPEVLRTGQSTDLPAGTRLR